MLFLTHCRIVAALLIREMASRFGSRPGGYLWAFLEPAGYVLLMTIVFQAVIRAPALGLSFPLFYATGYLSFHFYQSTLNYVKGSISGNKSLLSYPAVAPIDTIIARFILQVGTLAVVTVAVMYVIIEFEMRTAPTIDWAPVLQAFVFANLLALGFGMCNIILFAIFPFYESVFGIVTRPLLLVSGVFFIPDSLPHPFREMVLINPIAHVIMLFRTGFYPEYRAIGLNVDYLYACTITGLFCGLLLLTLGAKIVRNE